MGTVGRNRNKPGRPRRLPWAAGQEGAGNFEEAEVKLDGGLEARPADLVHRVVLGMVVGRGLDEAERLDAVADHEEVGDAGLDHGGRIRHQASLENEVW